MVAARSMQDAASVQEPGRRPRATSHLLGDWARIILPGNLARASPRVPGPCAEDRG